jgi:nudix-type nucleoside diphosphatase (YffH/AdpP family)
MSISDRIRVKDVRLLSNEHYKLMSVTFEWRRASVLPYNLKRRTVVLVKQFRYPAYIDGYRDLMIEAPAGLLDDAPPEERIRLEAEEETGYRLRDSRKIFEAFVSPGVMTEKMHLFVAEYDDEMRISAGGGIASEGEDIEVLELSFDEALKMVADGRIVDAKTIILLQYAALKIFQ